MNSFWENIFLEISLFIFLGVLYYLYQRRKIIQYEEQRGPLVMGFILQSCLAARKDISSPELDALIESLDDYLQNKTPAPPIGLLRHYMTSQECPEDLGDIIQEGLVEIESENGKK
jgi:hypothetical protein